MGGSLNLQTTDPKFASVFGIGFLGNGILRAIARRLGKQLL